MYRQRYEYRVIQEGLYNAFKDLVDKIYLTSRPAVNPSDPKSYIVIRLSSGIRDRGDTYQTARATVHIFVRDREGGIENAVLLDRITNRICDMMPLIEPRFTAFNPNMLSSGEDSGFHYHILQLSLTINKKTLKTKPPVEEEETPTEGEELSQDFYQYEF